jgi:hypothetical protein
MSDQAKAKGQTDLGAKGADAYKPGRLELAAIGMEAEFVLVVDDEVVRPEDLFGDPRAFVRRPMMHRVGTSYHLPTAGAIYFDTGVIEVATPVIEIEPGCAARAGRSLWESILVIRDELNGWERSTGRDARLVGFSTHYNISFELPRGEPHNGRSVEKLALLLSYILPVPVMLLAANRRSTGIGVRPRGDRIEITADFTPSASLMIAAATVITGIAREVMTWPSFERDMIASHDLPVIAGYGPMPHTSRKGWLARFDRYPGNPFTCDIDAPLWRLHGSGDELASLRRIGEEIVEFFWPAIRRISDPFTARLIESVFTGRAPSLLDLPERPPEYEDVGRLCLWDNLFPEGMLRRSRYERVMIRAISGQRLVLDGHAYTPVGMRGWSEVVFRRDDTGTRHTLSIDFLVRHLDQWERDGKRGN